MQLLKKYTRECLTAITALGTAYFYTLVIILLVLLDFKTKALYLVIGLLVCYISILIFRMFYFKERPVKEDYFNLFTKLNAASFPSLHAITFAYTSTVLATTIKNSKITIFLYLVTLLVAYSRVYIKKHYWIDIIVGLILGIIASAIYITLI